MIRFFVLKNLLHLTSQGIFKEVKKIDKFIELYLFRRKEQIALAICYEIMLRYRYFEQFLLFLDPLIFALH